MKTVDQVIKKVEQAQRIFDVQKELDEAKKQLNRIDINDFTKGTSKVIVIDKTKPLAGGNEIYFKIDIKTLSMCLQKRVDDAQNELEKLLNEF